MDEWLAPRIDDFRALHPDTKLHLSATVQASHILPDDIDTAQCWNRPTGPTSIACRFSDRLSPRSARPRCCRGTGRCLRRAICVTTTWTAGRAVRAGRAAPAEQLHRLPGGAQDRAPYCRLPRMDKRRSAGYRGSGGGGLRRPARSAFFLNRSVPLTPARRPADWTTKRKCVPPSASGIAALPIAAVGGHCRPMPRQKAVRKIGMSAIALM